MPWHFQYHIPDAKLHFQVSFTYELLLLMPKLSLVLVNININLEDYKDEGFHNSIHKLNVQENILGS